MNNKEECLLHPAKAAGQCTCDDSDEDYPEWDSESVDAYYYAIIAALAVMFVACILGV